MKVVVKSVLPCAAEKAWNEVNTSRLLLEVTSPIMSLVPVKGERLPQRWNAATTRVRMFLFGILPLGTHTIEFEKIDDKTREILTHEYDGLIRTWNHLVRIEPIDDKSCAYSDEIEIEPRFRILRPIVWLFGQVFYRHRQRRWQKVARRLAAA